MLPIIPPNSFTFGGVNSLDSYGIKCIAYDPFSASKRDRSQTIPFRHGQHDRGEKFYNDKQIRLRCILERQLTKAGMREIIFWLSQRTALRLWDEPDKFYMGELLNSVDITIFPQRIMQEFTLPIRCGPFAYSDQHSKPLSIGNNYIDYEGTAKTPTTIVIRNPSTGATSISNIVISVVSHRRA